MPTAKKAVSATTAPKKAAAAPAKTSAGKKKGVTPPQPAAASARSHKKKPSTPPAAAAAASKAKGTATSVPTKKTVDVDSLIISRRERKSTVFYEPGDEDANSAAKLLLVPMVPAPSSPFKPRKPKSKTPPSDTPKVLASQAKAAATKAGAKNDSLLQNLVEAASQSSNASGVATKSGKKAAAGKKSAAPSKSATAPAVGAAHEGQTPVVEPTAAAAEEPAAPRKPASKAKASAMGDTARTLTFDDTPATAATVSQLRAKAAAAVPSNLHVTHFLPDYEDRLGTAYALGFGAPDDANSDEADDDDDDDDDAPAAFVAANKAKKDCRLTPPLHLGFLFRDGTSLSTDASGLITYVNRHRHRFSIRNVHGSVSVPKELEVKFKVLAWLRVNGPHAAAAAGGSSKTTAAAAAAAAAAPKWQRVGATMTSFEHPMHYVASAAAALNPAEADDNTRTEESPRVLPYLLSAAPDGDAETRKFVVSNDSSWYPRGLYYSEEAPMAGPVTHTLLL